MARCATCPRAAAPTGRRQGRRPPRGHPRPLPYVHPHWPDPPRIMDHDVTPPPAYRQPGGAPRSRRGAMAAIPGTVAWPWGVQWARPQVRGTSRGALHSRGTPLARREHRPAVPGAWPSRACSPQRTTHRRGETPARSSRVGHLLPSAWDVGTRRGVRARSDAPAGPPACHRHPPRQPLTPAVSRRALDGTRLPQSSHWRGRLHCFVRPGPRVLCACLWCAPRAYWITSSARSSRDGGIAIPSTLAVFRLITSSNFTGCSTGRSAGLAPFRILSTCRAARRNISGQLGP